MPGISVPEGSINTNELNSVSRFVLAEVEDLLFLVVMHTLDYLRPHERAPGNNAFERNHVVEV